MTTPSTTTVLSPAPPAARVTPRGLAAAERIKLRSLRSATWLLGGTVAAVVVIGVVPALGVALGEVPPEGGDPAGGVLAGFDAAQLLLGAAGVVAVTSEYSSRTITATLTAVPRRLPVLAAKAVVVAAAAFAAGLGALLVAVLGAAALLAAGGAPVPVAGPALARLVVGAALVLAATALLGTAAGWLLRSTAGALAGLYAFLYVPTVLALFLPPVVPFLPITAARAVLQAGPAAGLLPPWAGLALYVAYAAAALAAAAVALTRRDA